VAVQVPEELSVGGSGDGPRLPPWLRITLSVLAVVAGTVVLGTPMLYYEEGTGGAGRVDQVTPAPTPTPTPTSSPVPVHLAASGPLVAPSASGPVLSFVGRIGPSGEAVNPRYITVSGGSVRPLSVPEGVVVPADDRQDLLVADPDRRLYAVPVDRVARFRRLGNALSVLGSRGDTSVSPPKAWPGCRCGRLAARTA
jgi:hypothetical protein